MSAYNRSAWTPSQCLCWCTLPWKYDDALRLFEWPAENKAPFTDVCILYAITPKRLILNGQFGWRSVLPGQLKCKMFYASRTRTNNDNNHHDNNNNNDNERSSGSSSSSSKNKCAFCTRTKVLKNNYACVDS